MERKTRFELATFSLARRCSTTEPLPHYNSVPRGRIELPTPAFSVLCSTTELPRRLHYSTKFNLLGIYDLWARQGSNLRPIGYEPTALPLSYGPLRKNCNKIVDLYQLIHSLINEFIISIGLIINIHERE